MEKEEDEEEDLFMEWPAEEGHQESAEDENEDEGTEMERQSELSYSRLLVLPDKHRASLPCLAQLSTMHLTHLTQMTQMHTATMAPSPVSIRDWFKEGEARKVPLYYHEQNQDTENKPKPASSSAIPNLLNVSEKRGRFRSRTVISLGDADSMCLICHGDLCKGGGTVRELHCSHSFHSECIEAWLWIEQTCPICRKHMAIPEPLYWTITHLKVP